MYPEPGFGKTRKRSYVNKKKVRRNIEADSQWGDRKGGSPAEPAKEKPREVGALSPAVSPVDSKVLCAIPRLTGKGPKRHF